MKVFSILVMVMALSCLCFAKDSISQESISSADHILKPLIGKRIQAEGIAWGAFAKGLGERVVLPSGDKLYLTGKEYLKKHPNGKLIRLVGSLSIKTMKPAPQGAQGYTQEFQYYAIEVESFELIDKVENEFPEELRKKSVEQKNSPDKK